MNLEFLVQYWLTSKNLVNIWWIGRLIGERIQFKDPFCFQKGLNSPTICENCSEYFCLSMWTYLSICLYLQKMVFLKIWSDLHLIIFAVFQVVFVKLILIGWVLNTVYLPTEHAEAVARLLAMAWKASLKVSEPFLSPGFPWGSTNRGEAENPAKSLEQWKGPLVFLGDLLGDEILPSCVGIIINHNKDPY